MKLMVLDGNSLVNRAFFGIKLLTTKDGRYTNAIYGFQNILLNLLAAHKPDAVAIAWDERAPTFRHTAYDGYKATRHGMPEELAQQMPVLKELLTDLGFVQVSKAGWEADDILGTLAAACEAAGGTTLLATGDRDSLQLVDDATTVLLATNKETIPMDPAAIREKYGIEPPQLIDVKSLMGDASDNIPGVPGIGEKTALALISKFGSLQGVYDNIDDKAVKPGQRAKLTANRDKADLSYMLGTIRKDAPIETDPAAYLRQPGDPAAAAQLLAALEMHKLVDRWGLNGGTAPAPSENAAPLETVEPSPLPLLLEGRFYAARNADGDWYLVQGQDVYLPDTDRLAAILDSGAELWAFDAKPLYRLALEHGGIGSALRFDGKLAAYLLNPSASGYEVHSLAAEYGVHAAFACEAAPDAGVLAGLCDTLAAALDESGQRKLLNEMELPLARVLADMERIGFAIDADGIRAFGDSLRSELDGILNNIYTTVGYPFNVNSPKQLGEALFDKLGLPPRKKNARGYSTDAATLESLRPYSPVIDEILKYRTYAKLLSTYVDGLLAAQAADGRVHSTFIQTETRTGRISSTEPNLQNIPVRMELGREIRKLFVPREGCVLVDADYSQIELRVLAHMSNDKNLIQAYRQAEDIHAITASQVFHVPLEEVTPQLRRNAKAVNFGIVYGISAFGLGEDLGISRKEATEYIERYFETYPDVKRFLDGLVKTGRKYGEVKTMYGRVRPIPELKSGNFMQRSFGERVAMNSPIQGTAADIIKIAMIRVDQRLRREGLRSRIVLQVHDELLIETWKEELEQVQSILATEMKRAAQLQVELEIDMKMGNSWFETK